MAACLELENLTVRYGTGSPVLNGCSLRIDAGEVVGLVGPSGCGKSTLMLAILGQLPAGARLDGTIRRPGRIGAIFQEPSSALNPVLKIGRQIMEIVPSKERALAALAEADLPAERIFNAYPHELSGGQQQRVLFVQATIREPELIVADEPASALDPDTKAVIMRLFAARKGKPAILFITHEEELLEGFADRVVRLR